MTFGRGPQVAQRVAGFGAAVRRRRKALGLSQERFADKAGVDRQTVNRYENAASGATLAGAFLLADGLGVPLAALLDDDPVRGRYRAALREIAALGGHAGSIAAEALGADHG